MVKWSRKYSKDFLLLNKFLGIPDIDAPFQNFTLPQEHLSTEIFLADEKFNSWKMYAFVYDTSLFSETLATKLDLVCKLYVNYLNFKNCIIIKLSLTI